MPDTIIRTPVAAQIKPNYTAKQNIIADWIVLGHNAEIIRSNKKARCYITTAGGSHWYDFVRTGSGYRRGNILPDGNMEAFGANPGGPTVVNHSKWCGVIIYSRDRKQKGKPINS